MTQAKLIKMVPTILMVAFLGFLGYSVQGNGDEAPGQSSPSSATGSTLIQVEKELIALESAIVSSASAVRDPFRTVASASQEIKAEATNDGVNPHDDTDHIAEAIKAMSLDATFLQGDEQIAYINGKMYRRGQQLQLPDKNGEPTTPLLVAVVRKDKVYFRGANKTYSLGYPERLGGVRHPKPGDNEAGLEAEMAEIDPAGELEFYKSLMNSPLGKMGKGLTGSMGIKLPPQNANGSQSRGQ